VSEAEYAWDVSEAEDIWEVRIESLLDMGEVEFLTGVGEVEVWSCKVMWVEEGRVVDEADSGVGVGWGIDDWDVGMGESLELALDCTKGRLDILCYRGVASAW